MKIIEDIAKKLREKPDIIAAYLYGSYNDGLTHEKSDIDIGILFENSSKNEIEAQVNCDDLNLELVSQFKKKFDIVDIITAPLPLQHSMIQGKTLFSKNPTATHILENTILSKVEGEMFYD